MEAPHGGVALEQHSDGNYSTAQDPRVTRLQTTGTYDSGQPVASSTVPQIFRTGSPNQSREVAVRSGSMQSDLKMLQATYGQQDGAPVQHRASSITRSSNPPHHRQPVVALGSPPPMSEMRQLGSSGSMRHLSQASSQAGDLVVEDVFLPRRNVHGEMVLVEMKAGQFRVTPGRHFPRLAFRASKELSDKMEESVKRGATIEGVDEGDGWVRCKIPENLRASSSSAQSIAVELDKVQTAIVGHQAFNTPRDALLAQGLQTPRSDLNLSCPLYRESSNGSNHALAPPELSGVDVNRTMDRLMKLTESVQEQLAVDRADIISQSIMHCELLEEKLAARIDLSVSNLRAELAEIGVFPSSSRRGQACGDLSAQYEASSTASTAASQMHTGLEERLIARIALEVANLKVELLENGVLHEAAAGEASGLGEHLVALAAKDESTLNVITEEVLQRVKNDKSIRHVEEQHDMLKQTLHELLIKLDRGPQGVVQSKDFNALCDTVNESVKLNRALGLELRHQRQQRNQDHSSITKRLASVDAKLLDLCEGPGHADTWSDSSRSDGSKNLLSFVPNQQPDAHSDGLEQALQRLHELSSKELTALSDPWGTPRVDALS